MKPKIRIIRDGHLAVDLVKLVVCAIIFTHGIHRYLYGEVGPLGDALAHFGFPFPHAQAQLVNLAETGGVLLIALGVFVRAMCAVLVLIFATGIALIHWQLGFFILGPGEGGWEFSALLIACFTAVALDYWPRRERLVVAPPHQSYEVECFYCCSRLRFHDLRPNPIISKPLSPEDESSPRPASMP